MIPNYEEQLSQLTQEEIEGIVSQMGMNMTDHPYLSEKRRVELQASEDEQIAAYQKSIEDSTENEIDSIE
jgi:CTP:phosphocholine cytidylyltransferase-like protein